MQRFSVVIHHGPPNFSATTENASAHLSACPAAAGQISERGRKDRQLKNSALNEESRSNSGHNNNAKSQ
jgi:hypothetical protein